MIGKKIHYGFLICFCGILSMFCVGAVAGTISAYMPYMIADSGLTKTQGSSIFTIICLVSLVVTTFILEPYYRRFSYRIGISIALTGAALNYAIYSVSTGYLGYCVGAVIGGVVYALAGMVPLSIVMNTWFISHKSLVLGLCAAGTGVASITVPMILSALIGTFSLSGVFCVMAILMGAIACIVYIFLRDCPHDMGLSAYGSETAGRQSQEPEYSDADPGTMTCMLIGILLLGAVTGGGYQHISVLYTASGFAPLSVSRLLSIGGLVMIAGKCLYGFITDKIGVYKTNFLFLGFLTIGWCLCCMAGKHNMVLAVGSVLCVNLGMALSTVGLSTIAKQVSSEKNYGRTVKNFQVFTMIGTITFNTVPGIMADHIGSYLPAYWLVILITICAAVLVEHATKRTTF